MFRTLKTLMTGANRRAEAELRDHFSIELIEEKIAQAGDNLKTAKATLVGLIQKERGETRQIAKLDQQIADLTARAQAALEAGREDLATTAAQGIADMENERSLRQQTLERLEGRILRLRQSVEAANRRILDLKQGAIAARAVKSEARMQSRLKPALEGQPMDEAAELIAQVMGQDDPFEASDILSEIDRGLAPQNLSDTLADAGFGAPTRASASAVLGRLKAGK
ncbi:phage shock protein A [Tritonibacter multivorans]|uniref:Phage shock protein A n=1 Tax=Tritonibacter multivorans TaxID=928856 RepID=A0A0P1GI17_9RHOB|nr:PspA/IM30 family protein [Tritonibacter multivorans]MDA7420612.1 PspA/IM30 family protein [Tritonibacter multivorans]CUH81272.1 phage shock protein A [Tritonibacter multivorans]SFC32041.1 phage shock protein A (PspA) family protein [Tritonibacter multivorans]